MIELLQPFIDAMQGEQGIVLQISAWMVALRTGFKPFSARLQLYLERIVSYVHETPETDDDKLLQRVLSSRAYRVLAFAIDFLASIKLPRAAVPSTPSTPSILAPLLIAALFATGCGTLDPAGPYDGDQILFRADQSISATYDTLHVFVSWEYLHRDTLAKWPEIRQAADYVRAHAEDWVNAATYAREQYAVYRSPETRSSLTAAITELKKSAADGLTLYETYGPSHRN